MKRRFRRQASTALLAAWVLLFASSGAVQAHFTSMGYSELAVQEQSLHYQLYLSEHDLLEAYPTLDANGDLRLSETELHRTDSLETVIDDGLIVTGDSDVLTGRVEQARYIVKAKSPMIQIGIVYDVGKPVKEWMAQYNLFYDGTDMEHQSFASIQVGGQSIQQVINSRNNILLINGTSSASPSVGSVAAGQAPASLEVEQAWADVFQEYTRMGMEHIWAGWDHLLFVMGLLLMAGSRWKDLLKLITFFTIGHSITIILASLELASLSPLIVEPLIALSIAYIAVENILRRKESSKQGWVTLGFGLVHGFGFAEILRGTLSDNVALPLFSFNLGVELGQLVVVMAALPILWGIRKLIRHPAWTRYAMGGIGAMGLYWFVERVVANITNS